MTEPAENEKTLFFTQKIQFYQLLRTFWHKLVLSSSCDISWKMIEKNHANAWIDFWFSFVRQLHRACENRGLNPPQIQDKLVEDDDDDDLSELVPCKYKEGFLYR